MKKVAFFFLGIGVIYLVISINYSKNRGGDNYNIFYNSFINGKIESVGVKLKGVKLKISTNETEYVFYPYTHAINEKKSFTILQRKGIRFTSQLSQIPCS